MERLHYTTMVWVVTPIVRSPKKHMKGIHVCVSSFTVLCQYKHLVTCHKGVYIIYGQSNYICIKVYCAEQQYSNRSSTGVYSRQYILEYAHCQPATDAKCNIATVHVNSMCKVMLCTTCCSIEKKLSQLHLHIHKHRAWILEHEYRFIEDSMRTHSYREICCHMLLDITYWL